MKEFFYAKDIEKIAKISRRQLQYWDETGFLSPTLKSVRRRKYTFRDLSLVKIAIHLLDHGYSLYGMRKIFEGLKSLLPNDMESLIKLHIMIRKKEVIVFEKGGFLKMINSTPFQQFNLAEFYKEIDFLSRGLNVTNTEQMNLWKED